MNDDKVTGHGGSERNPRRPSWERTRLPRVLWYASVPTFVLVVVGIFLAAAPTIRGRDAIYPVVTLIALLLVTLIALGREIRFGLAGEPEAADELEDSVEGERGRGVAWPRVGVIVAAIVAMLVVFALFGYVPAITFLCVATVSALGLRSPLWIAVFAIVTAAAAYLVFAIALGSPLPTGLLI